MRLLAISGSLRRGSYNGALLAAAAATRPHGVEFVTWRGLAEIPAFDEDLAVPPAVAALKREIARADAVLFATPEYNGSFPGALKNALDWVSRPFATQRPAGQAGRGRRGEQGSVRRRVGAGRPAKGPVADRRLGRRARTARSALRTSSSAVTSGCAIPPSQPG